MKLFTNKKLIQKMTIVLVILMLFNFISPCYVRAETSIETAGNLIVKPVRGFFVMIADAFMNGFQYLLVTNEKAVIPASDQVDAAENFNGDDSIHGNRFFNDSNPLVENIFGQIAEDLSGYWEDIPNFKYTPQRIFEGNVKSFSINFINGGSTKTNPNTNNNQNVSNQGQVNYDQEDWYKAYKIAIDKLKEETKKAYADGDENKALAALQILKGLGCTITGVSDASKVDSIQIPDANIVRNIIKKLTNKYYNGQDIYAIFGFNKNKVTENDKNGCPIIDQVNIIGILGTYHNDVGDDKTSGEVLDYDGLAPINALHGMIATWYRIMRNIALLFLLSILVYTGIRIMLSSTAADTAKYKSMLVNWVVALCILFALHYIMAFTNSAIDLIVDAFSTSGSEQANWTDSIFGSVRLALQSDNISNQIFYTILYLVLVIFTVVFTFYYLKRVVYAAFLTMIAPLVALTYPIDKMGDGQSQAFDFWLKEYIMNAVIQPVHLLIYTILISSVFTLASTNPLYALVVMGAMIPTEKFIREMFGLNSKKGPGPVGGLAGGALAMNAFAKLMHGKPPHLNKPKDNNSGKELEKKPRTQSSDKGLSASDYSDFTNGIDIPQSSDNNVHELHSISGMQRQGSIGNDIAEYGQPNQNRNQYDDIDEIGLPEQAEVEARLNPPREANTNDVDYQNAINDMDSIDSIDLPDQETINSTLKPSREFNNNDIINESAQEQVTENVIQSRDNEPYQDIQGMEISPQQSQNEQQENSRRMSPRRIIRGIRNVPRTIKKANDNMRKGVVRGVKKLTRQPIASEQAQQRADMIKKQYYRQKNKEQARMLGKAALNIGKGAIKASGTALGVAAGATIATAATIASGDPNKFMTNMATGVLAGAKGGGTLGDTAIGGISYAASGIGTAIKDSKEMNKQYQEILQSEDKEYKKAVRAKENKRKAHSRKAKQAIEDHYGVLSKEQEKAKMTELEEWMNAGVKDMEFAMRGMDFVKDGTMNKEDAIIASKLAYEYEQGTSRSELHSEAENGITHSLVNQGMSLEEASNRAESMTDRSFANMDRIRRVKENEIGRPEKQLRNRQRIEKQKAIELQERAYAQTQQQQPLNTQRRGRPQSNTGNGSNNRIRTQQIPPQQ